jgi:hypothetical protein
LNQTLVSTELVLLCVHCLATARFSLLVQASNTE